jgi:hypothetical protein
MSIFKNGDPLASLPTDKEELSFKEKTLVDMLYPSPVVQNIPADTKKAWYHFKDIIIATVLFFILNLPITDNLLSKFVKKENFYYSLAAKSAIFAILFFVINNFYLSRTK